jgi:methionyl-tRNA formyltransferase
VRIAYFGLPLAALLLLEDGFEIEIAVLSRTDAPGRRRLAKKLGNERVRFRDEVSI